jgi:pilus assembly protein CpaC
MRTCHCLLAALSFVVLPLLVADLLPAQTPAQMTPVSQQLGQNQRIQLITGTSRVIKFDFDVPGIVVGSPEIVDVQPISSNQIMVTGRRHGVTGISISDAQNNQHTLDIIVVGDCRQLQLALNELFPNSNIRAMPLNTNVVLTGHVGKETQIAQIESVATDFFPNGVRNFVTVGGPKKIALECRVVEVSRTKLRDMGIDWSLATSGFTVQNSASALLNAGTGSGNFFFQIVDGTDQFPLFLNLLRQNNLAKILTQPTVVTTPGRPASLLNGGLIPIPINSGLGVQSVEFREFGTKLDVLPMLEGDGRIRVEVRAEVTDVAPDLAVNGTPGFRSRNVDTGVPLREGQTLALAGLIQSRTDSVSRGIPGLKDMPWIGSLFRRVEDTYNEVELIILVTPRFIAEVDPSEVPAGPGTQTVLPRDRDFFWRGYQEVPRVGTADELGIEQPVLDFDSLKTDSTDKIEQTTRAGGQKGDGQRGLPMLAKIPVIAKVNRSLSPAHTNQPLDSGSFQPLPERQSTLDPYTVNRTPVRSVPNELISRFHLSDN